ncbi:MAG: ABC transporter ATP-binding protein [Clostridia bacterium]|nr:ABC transporter ATP-binding protein [Clostridia bacterium]
MKAVIAENLSKTYASGKEAVKSIGFSLDQGEVFGFLGPNGSGKTTTVKLLNGMLSPTGGSCRVFDMDPSAKPEQIHAISGVVTEHAQMYDNMTGLQNLLFYGALFGVSPAQSKDRALALLSELDLMDAKDRKLAAYSTGMRQRLSLARAMIHQPKILFLDEPTSGLDPESVLSVNHMIKSLAKNDGATIFLCTHQLRYAQEICSSYGLIDEGVLLAAGSIEALRSLVFSGMTVSIKTGEQQYEINVQSEDEIPLVVKRIVDEGGSVYHVSARRLSLEEIYFALLEKKGEAK